MKEKEVKGLILGCFVVLINIVVVIYFSVCYRGMIFRYLLWYLYLEIYLVVWVIEMVFGIFDFFVWIFLVLIFCVICMLLEKMFEILGNKMFKEFIYFFMIV